MKALLLTLLPIMCACASLAQDKQPVTTKAEPKKNAVVEPVENVKQLLPADAAQHAHVLFVNVDGALPDKAFREAVAYVRMKYLLNVVVRNERKPFASSVVADPASLIKRFGDKAVIVVAVVRQEKGPSFINVPGRFSQVNLRGLDKDGPEANFLAKRQRQMLLKGLAHACGIGATLDQLCVMAYSSFTLAGMDAVSTTYGPNAYFALRDTLLELGGPEIFAPL